MRRRRRARVRSTTCTPLAMRFDDGVASIAARPREAMATPMGSAGRAAAIRVGVGGWTFEPWRDNFYPAGWPIARELEYASRQLTVIEVNGTYYSLQSAATFAKWREQTPDGFVFTLKATRYATN